MNSKDYVKTLDVVELRKQLVSLGLSTKGTKPELEKRLRKYLEENGEVPNRTEGKTVKKMPVDPREEKLQNYQDYRTKRAKRGEEEDYNQEESESDGEYQVENLSPEDQQAANNSYSLNLRENIQRFFKYNKNNLVREKLAVEELERKKARSWVFVLITLQIIINVTYGAILLNVDRETIIWIVSASMTFYFALKLGSVFIFFLKNLFSSKCCSGSYDPTLDYSEIFICIPAYNEGREAFLNTINSIDQANYPKEKLYMFFIVDGNRGNSFESLMSVLRPDVEWKGKVKEGERSLQHGIYNGIGWSVFLKEKNRGKRDSQWLFVELVRNVIPQFVPPFLLFIDSDTSFDPDSIRYLEQTLSSSEKVAGVCGRLKVSNFKLDNDSFGNFLFSLSTLFIVGYQYYEYHFNQILGKQAEAAWNSVSCLPGAFSMFRSDVMVTVEAHEATEEEKQNLKEIAAERQEITASQFGNMTPFSFFYRKYKKTLPLILNDFFSKPTIGITDRNLYELGEDRTLTIRLLEKGYRCLYDPRAVAYTEVPDTLLKLLLQRRRWNNSTFVNLLTIPFKFSLWFQPKTIPILIFTFYDLIGAYLLPANSIILMALIWQPLFDQLNSTLGVSISAPEILFWWLMFTFVIISAAKLPDGEMFFVLTTFFTSLLMAGSLWFFLKEQIWPPIDDFIQDPSIETLPLFVLIIIFPVLHLIVSVSAPWQFVTSVFFYLMLPTVAITIPVYSFFHLDDFSWGNR